MLLAFLGGNVFGMFVREATEQVPIARLFKNLNDKLATNTNDFSPYYYLARLHAMAYATNLTEATVTKEGNPTFDFPGYDSGVPRDMRTFPTAHARSAGLQHLTNAIQLYERAIVLFKKSTNISEQKWMILPVQLGLAWCVDQEGQTNKALVEYRKALRISWKLEVTGDFDFKQWIQDVWTDTKSGKNPIRSHDRSYLGPGVCYSEEITGYMLKLLDPVKDAEEISELKKKQTKLTTMGRAVTPVLVPLSANLPFSELVNESANVCFDLDGSGLARSWGWITPKAAWLVFDKKGGEITSGLQMFGNVTFWIFWPDGYAALGALDDNGDGQLSGPELAGLALWQDSNGNGFCEPGEVRSLDEFGIVAIACRSEQDLRGMKWSPQGVLLRTGCYLPTYDWVVPSNP